MRNPCVSGFGTLFVALLMWSLVGLNTRAFAAGAVTPSPAHPPLKTLTNVATPALSLTALDGGSIDLAAFKHPPGSSVVIVHFFATWCEPCRDELASLAALASVPGSPFAVLAVNVAEVPARVRKFLAGTPVPFPVLMDRDRTATKAWGVSTLPASFVLDAARVPRLMAEGEVDWQSSAVRAALESVAAGAPR